MWQAMCELYDRPAQIYRYDSVTGAKLLDTLHEGAGAGQPPIRYPLPQEFVVVVAGCAISMRGCHTTLHHCHRLSYYGGGHYDSIVGAETADNWITYVLVCSS